MRAPLLNRALLLEEAQRQPDGAGGSQLAWVALGRLWAAVEAGPGRAREGEAVALSSTGLRITVRAAPQGDPARPRPDQRFREGARIFRILSVTERDARGRYLVCQAREEVAT